MRPEKRSHYVLSELANFVFRHCSADLLHGTCTVTTSMEELLGLAMKTPARCMVQNPSLHSGFLQASRHGVCDESMLSVMQWLAY